MKGGGEGGSQQQVNMGFSDLEREDRVHTKGRSGFEAKIELRRVPTPVGEERSAGRLDT